MPSVLDEARAKLAEEVKIDVLSGAADRDNELKWNQLARTFITDAITVPSKEMYDYAFLASRGDDEFFGEQATSALEAHIAKITGKEAALFMPSGTMSNQVALRTHLTQPPYTILCDHRAHIYKYEVGGPAFHSGAAITPVIPSNGHHLTLEDVKANMIYGPDVHFAPTEIIALENTMHGTIIPQKDVVAISEFARSKGVKMHLDGARVWHVAAETGASLKEILEPFDSATMCFGKGLGAPIGSCLVGPKDYITTARRFRKIFGGGMRKTGFLAGCAAYALTHNFPLLPRVHALAFKLQTSLAQLGVTILAAETCMVIYDPSSIGVTLDEIAAHGAALPEPLLLGSPRLVVHIQTSEAAVDDLIHLVATLAEEKRKAGFIEVETKAVGKTSDVYIAKAD